jgi:lysophospholipid acyltransferase (LPLAT)-like uncharacterized protein
MAATRFLKRLPGVVTWFLALAVRLYSATLRVRVEDYSGLLTDEDRPATIYLVWHDRLLCTPALAPQALRDKTAILVSRSRDGGYVAGLLTHWGYDSVRGSSSKGGLAALRAMKRHLQEGKQIVITPDGPRGPAFSIQKGTVWLARSTGARVVPLSLNMERPWRLNGWDRTQIPKPFSSGTFIVGNPVVFPEDASAEEMHRAISDALCEISGDQPAEESSPG